MSYPCIQPSDKRAITSHMGRSGVATRSGTWVYGMHAITVNVWVTLPLPTQPSALSLHMWDRLHVCWGPRPSERASIHWRHDAAQPAPNGPQVPESGSQIPRAPTVCNYTCLRLELGVSALGASYAIVTDCCSARALQIEAHSTWSASVVDLPALYALESWAPAARTHISSVQH